MNSIFNVHYFLLILLVGCVSSGSNGLDSFDKNSVDGFEPVRNTVISRIFSGRKKAGIVETIFQDTSIIESWNAYNSSDKQISFSLPEGWKIKESKTSILYSYQEESKGNYFALLVHDKLDHDINLIKYKDFLIQTYSSDQKEQFQLLELAELAAKEQAGFYIFLSSTEDNKKYQGYSFITENERYIFDFSLKIDGGSNIILSKYLFFSILHTFNICGTYILGAEYEFLTEKGEKIRL